MVELSDYFPITIEFEDGETRECQSERDIPRGRGYRVIVNAANLPNDPAFVAIGEL